MAAGFTGFTSGENDLEGGIVEGDSSSNGSVVHKEFFWDKSTTFIASVLFGLATLNLFTQLLPRDSGIACDFSEFNGNISDATVEFLLGLCSKALPPFTFLPVGVIVQGVLIAGPHFIWKSTFLSQLDYFFSSVSTLSLNRDSVTGHYPIENRVMIKQLESSFTFCGTSDIFTWYRRKLFVQFTVNLIVVVVSIAVPLTVFNSDIYDCSIPASIWPTQRQANSSITCVLVTFRLFTLIWACDITLVLIMLPILFWGILWCYLRHPTQLGHNDVAAFSFNSGIISKYAFSRPYFSSNRLGHNTRWSNFFHPRIRNDLDFMLMLLFKVNDGVGHVFKEGLVEIEMDRLNDIETQLLESYLLIQDDPELESDDGNDELLDDRDKEALSLKWSFPAKEVQLKFKEKFKEIDLQNGIRIPNCIRGSIMGMCLRAPDNFRALEIGFSSTYGNYALALARIFFKVGYINFDAFYRPTWRQQEQHEFIVDSDEPLEEEETSTIHKKAHLTESIPHDLVHVNEISSSFITFRVQDNILTQSTEHIMMFNRKLHALFKDEDGDETPVSFIVIGPINQREHLTTVKLFLESTDAISDKAIVVTLRPISIEGRNTKKYFHKFIPPKSVGFESMSQTVEVVNEEVDWNDPLLKQPPTQTFNPITVSCGPSSIEMELQMYQCCNSHISSNQSSATIP